MLITPREIDSFQQQHCYPHRKDNDNMKAKLHTLIHTVMLGLVLGSTSIPAWAGTVARKEVSINSPGTIVQGSLTGTRYSADGQQYLGCYTHSYPTQPTVVVCDAKDKTGRSFHCSAFGNGRLAAALMGMTDSSHLNIVRNQSSLECTDIEVTNESVNLR
jgi:hypothetical protein